MVFTFNKICAILRCMNTDKLVAVGLSPLQASAYALLLEKGEAAPADAAKQLKTTRTNSYKLFDKLVEMKLAIKKEVAKKYVYFPANPQAIATLVAEQRNIAVAREEAARNVLSELLAKYHTHTDQPSASIVTGKSAVADAYRTQIKPGEPIYFVRSQMDIPVMGFDLMHEIRTTPERHGSKRYGITPDISTGTTANPTSDKRSGLTRTWMRQEDYTAPVEWSVSGSTLVIVLFSREPHAITIESPLIADAFRQMWQILNTCLQNMPYYSELPRKLPLSQ